MPIDKVRLQTDGVYESQIPLSALAGDMDAIARIGEEWKKTRKKLLWAGVAVLLVGLPTFSLDSPVLGLVLVTAGVAVLIWAYRYRLGVITHLQRCTTVKSVAAMLKDDTHAKAPLTVKVALKSQRTLLHEAARPMRPKGKEKFYLEPWLTLEVRLLDGTTLSENISDLVRERSYRNARGKSKTKTRVHQIVALRFIYPQTVYGDLRPSAAKVKDPIRLPATARLKALSITDRDIKVKATVTNSEDLAKSCSMLALGVYRLMNLGRKLAAHQGGAH